MNIRLSSSVAFLLCLVTFSGSPSRAQNLSSALPAAALSHETIPLTTLNAEHNLSDPLTEVRDPSVAWIKSSTNDVGTIVSGFTLNESPPGSKQVCFITGNPPHLSPGCGVAASSFTNSLFWGNNPTYTARRWYEAPAWPEPSNFCDLYDCGFGSQWAGYAYVAETLWTGIDNVAVLVTTGGEQHDIYDTRYDEIALVSSIDGGQTFLRSKIVTVDLESGIGIDPKSISASVHRDLQVGTMADGRRERAIYLVWRNNASGKYQWWTTKVLFGIDGHFAQPAPPRKLDNIPSHVERLTILSYHFDNYYDQHWVDLAYGELLDENGNPTSRPACPSNKTVHVKWWLTRTPHYNGPMDWYCFGNGTCVNNQVLLAEDKKWRPCVGTGFAPGGNPWLANDERVSYTSNAEYPRTFEAAISRSSKADGDRMRIHLYEYLLENNPLLGPYNEWTLTHVTTGDDNEDHYGQQQALQKGTDWPANSPIVAYSYMVSNDKNETWIEGKVSPVPVGIAFPWQGSDLFTTKRWAVNSDYGTRHGLTAQQICVDKDEGSCGGVSALWPDYRFYVVWPMVPEKAGELWGRAFSH